MATTRISELTAIIAANTAKVDEYLASQGLPTPSFDADSPPKLVFQGPVATYRQAILDATDELHALMLGPIGILTSPPHNFLISLQAIYRFQLATRFPSGQDEATFAEISRASGLAEVDLRRILRHAMTNHIFKEPRKGVVAHTAASKMLAVNPLMHQWVGMVSEEMWPSAARTVDALAKWPGSQEPNHAVRDCVPDNMRSQLTFFWGFNIAHGTEETVFDEFATQPLRAQRYAEAMSWFSTGPGFEPLHILDNYPWEALGEATVVDIGGSHGSISIALAQRFPSIRCIVQDRPEVIAKGKMAVPQNVSSRVSFMAHDFFTEQPITGAEVYYFRWILHDWSDKYAIRILRALIPALKPEARILVSEYILPDPGVLSPYQDRVFRGFDLSMMEFHNSKERDKDDWVALFSDADPRFKVLSVRRPARSNLGIIEIAWEEN